MGKPTPKIVQLSCRCGTIQGELSIVDGTFFHVHCLCCDCQQYAETLENTENILDEHGGTELFQTYPAYLSFATGKDSIGCIQLREKGLYRWYATCCNTPLANTMRSPNIPFVGISVKLMQFDNDQEKLEALGPVTLKAFGHYAKGSMPADAHIKFPLSFMPKIISFMLKGLWGKKQIPSPFFKDGKPVVAPKPLTNT